MTSNPFSLDFIWVDGASILTKKIATSVIDDAVFTVITGQRSLHFRHIFKIRLIN
jgi:hypothetical protein